MRLPKVPGQRGRHLAIGHQHPQLALERIGHLGILGGLDLRNQPVQARAEGRIGHLNSSHNAFREPELI